MIASRSDKQMPRCRIAALACRATHLCCALSLLSGLNVAAAKRDLFEPSVSQEESVQLQRATDVASTNSSLAVEMLTVMQSAESSAAIDFAIANLLFQERRLELAAEAYRKALEKLPHFRSAIENLGRVYLLQERTDEAIALYQELVADGQADAGILMLLGHALLMQDSALAAESAYRQSLLLRPKHAETKQGLAKALMQQERYKTALSMVREILKQQPTNGELWSLRANAQLQLGEHSQAIKTIEQARRLNCATPGMLATLGDLLLNAQQPHDALQAYEQAFKGDSPSLARMMRAVRGFLMLRDVEKASLMIAKIEARVDRDSNIATPEQQLELLRIKSEHAQQAGESAKALAICEEILQRDPLDARTMLLLASLYERAGRLEEAVMVCERAARIGGSEADALLQQAQIEVGRNRYEEAVSLLESAQVFDARPYVARYLEQVRQMASLTRQR